jgi:cellulose synthase/poly-beta-1,6-N-acetylglucosamine synthase-like glycosyltransferase
MLLLAMTMALLVVATAACLAYVLPTLIGVLPERRASPAAACPSFAILIPAHDEQLTLPHTLASLRELDYPAEQVCVYVVADNCTDSTQAIAESAGAVCLPRTDPLNRGKGHAIAFGLKTVLPHLPDLVLVIDADCRLNPTALHALAGSFAEGAEAVQCAVRSRNADDGAAGFVAAVGAAIEDGRARGFDRLGLPVRLRGTGMAFRRKVLTRVPWLAFGLAEDAQYARQLRRAGVRVRYCGKAVLSCESPSSVGDLCRQRRRWRAAGALESKPLLLLQLAMSIVAAVACGFVWWPAGLIVLTAACYLRAMWVVGMDARRTTLLFRSPGILVRLGWLSLAGFVRREPATWDRTPRQIDREAASPLPAVRAG